MINTLPRLRLAEWTYRFSQGKDQKEQKYHIPGYTGHIHGEQHFFSEPYGQMTLRALTPRANKKAPLFASLGLKNAPIPTTTHRDSYCPFRRVEREPGQWPSKERFIYLTTPRRHNESMSPRAPVVEYVKLSSDTGDATRFNLSEDRRIPGYDPKAPLARAQTAPPAAREAQLVRRQSQGFKHTERNVNIAYLWRGQKKVASGNNDDKASVVSSVAETRTEVNAPASPRPPSTPRDSGVRPHTSPSMTRQQKNGGILSPRPPSTPRQQTPQ